MVLRLFFLVFIPAMVAVSTSLAQVQPQGQPEPPIFNRNITQGDDDRPMTTRDQLRKAQIERARKDHKELLKRGDRALELSEELKASLDANGSFTGSDLKDLEELEEIVERIRRDLGGRSDKDVERETESEIAAANDVKEIFSFLRSSTVKLVDELKKGSRFTISAAAINASNTIISVARFLRLRK